jgi:hypothetical protein
MMVRLHGLDGHRRVERRWTLIAEQGQGPEIPALAIPILLAKLERGPVAAGARDASTSLQLDDFQSSLAELPVRHGLEEIELPPPLYVRIMRERFAQLPPTLQLMHSITGEGGASGRGSVTRGDHLLARLAARLFGFPETGEHDLHVQFEEDGDVERWTRTFSSHRFSSRLSARGDLLVERFGLLHFGFDLPSVDGVLNMVLRRWWLWKIPLPLALAPRSHAREWEEDGRFHFDVPISMPLAGLVVHYRGWLVPTRRAEQPSDNRGGSASLCA